MIPVTTGTPMNLQNVTMLNLYLVLLMNENKYFCMKSVDYCREDSKEFGIQLALSNMSPVKNPILSENFENDTTPYFLRPRGIELQKYS